MIKNEFLKIIILKKLGNKNAVFNKFLSINAPKIDFLVTKVQLKTKKKHFILFSAKFLP